MKAEFNLTVPSFFLQSVLAASESSDVDSLVPFARTDESMAAWVTMTSTCLLCWYSGMVRHYIEGRQDFAVAARNTDRDNILNQWAAARVGCGFVLKPLPNWRVILLLPIDSCFTLEIDRAQTNQRSHVQVATPASRRPRHRHDQAA